MIQELQVMILAQTLLGSVIIITAYTKIKEWLGLKDTFATIGAFIFGGLLGAAANLLHIAGSGSIFYSIFQGLVSAFIATGGYDLIFKGK